MIPQTLPRFGTRSFVSLAPLAIDYGVNEVSRLANMAMGFSEIKQSD